MKDICLMDAVSVLVEIKAGIWEEARFDGTDWVCESVRVMLTADNAALRIQVLSPGAALRRIALHWAVEWPGHARLFRDHWERGYGDLGWYPFMPDMIFPWYTACTTGDQTWAIGVRTGAGALCYWEWEPRRIRLVCDMTAGPDGVELGNRACLAAEVTQAVYEQRPPFDALRHFCRTLCPKPLTVEAPVYGINDWSYAYGLNTAAGMARDARALASLTDGMANRPFCVIDAGYAIGRTACSGLPATITNRRFPRLPDLLDGIRSQGIRPGLWVRPLRTVEHVPAEWLRQGAPPDRDGDLLDPTVPEVVDYAVQEISTLTRDWGAELIKHDFTTFDITGQWGVEMLPPSLQHPTLGSFRRQGRTTAEVVRDLYRAFRQAADDAYLIGCNTIGHLAAGLVEIQRIGDDNSGKNWGRTRKMGINALAFRGVHQDLFYQADADCVALTDAVPWRFTAPWLDLVARSGTPLFVSADCDRLNQTERNALAEAFRHASVAHPLAEPLDALDTFVPARWRVDGEERLYDWYGETTPTRSAWGN